MSRAWNHDPSHPVPHLRHLMYFSSALLSLCKSKIGQPLTSPTAPPDNLLPLPVAWLNPCCQSAVLFCALHAPVRCRLVTGYLGFTHCCCACLFICSLFHGSKKQFLLPPTLQLNSFHHTPTAPSLPAISAPNPILLKTVIEQLGMLGLGLLLGILLLQEKFG